MGLRMHVQVFSDPIELAGAAANEAISSIDDPASLFNTPLCLWRPPVHRKSTFFQNLTRDRSIDWSRVELFHLDEYIGLGIEHPASFARYIRDRLIHPPESATITCSMERGILAK